MTSLGDHVVARHRPELAFRVFARLDASFVGGPDSTGRSIGHAGVRVKETWGGSPFCVANEYICGTIGRFLGLPIPPCELVRMPHDGYGFASLDFNYERERMPPVLAEVCVQHQPKLSAGILLFDILIANPNRHDANLVSDDVTAPQQVIVFDHDQALFGGGGELKGAERLEKLRMSLGIGVPGGLTGGTGHCLLPFISTAEDFEYWLDRIREIPKWVFEDACYRVAETGIRESGAKRAAEFLHFRSRRLPDIILLERKAFTSITEWPDWGGLFS